MQTKALVGGQKQMDKLVDMKLKDQINGDLMTKKVILQTLGSNFLLKDSVLTLETKDWLIPIKEDYPSVEKDLLTLELREMLSETERESAFDELCTRTRALRDSNPQPSGSKPDTLSG